MNNSAMSENKVEEVDISDKTVITTQTLADITHILNMKSIYTNAVQQQMLESHIRAMVLRSITGEPLPEVDKSLFDEISADSMKMAEQVIAKFATLPIEEAYLLSVHFEVAKDNNQ